MITYVTKRSGETEPLDLDKINNCVIKVCKGLEDVSASSVVLSAKLNMYEGIKTSDIDKAMILSARSLIEVEPNYSYVAARLLLNTIYKEVFGISINDESFEVLYRAFFIESIEELTREKILDSKLSELFDLEELSEYIRPERDNLFKYLGLQTLLDRYLKRNRNQKLCQAPQMFYMIIAMGLSMNEDGDIRQELCKKLYDALSCHEFSPSTPTLFNAGTTHSQLSSCYLSSIGDSLDGIMGEFHGQARLSKYAGGLGVDITNVRGANSAIEGTNGKSSGIVPFASLFDRILLAFNQAGKRYGSGALYLEPWHIDILDFLQLRKTTGDDRRRARHVDTAVWMNDLLMEYKKTDKDWYLFCPNECKTLHSTYGEEFKREYEKYVDMAKKGKLKNFKIISSKKLIKEIYTQYCETGHPFVCFKDSSNIRYMNKDAGIINSSNLCCVAGDQLVSTEEGLVYVKELYEKGKKNIVVGRTGYHSASEMLLPRPNAEMLEVVITNGMKHKVTPDHPLWVKNVGWVEARNLKKGDSIAIQSIRGKEGKVNEPDLAYICGVLCGQNNLKESTRIEFNKNTEHLMSTVTSVLDRLVKDYVIEDIILKKVILINQFDDLIYKEGKLAVPDFVLKGNKATVNAFLTGVFTMGGQSKYYRNVENIKLGVFSFSEKFVSEFQCLLFNNLIYNKSFYSNRQGKHKLFFTFLYNSTDIQEIDRITNIKALRKDIEYPRHTIERDPTHKDIQDINKLPNEDAYCLTVNSKDHDWTANGTITKNTEILEHTVPSEYNSYGYKTKIGETAVCTLNSINIVKHVNPDLTLNYNKIRDTIRLQVRCLDNAIDNNFYPTEEAAKSAKLNRQLGIGLMGLQEYLHMSNTPYSSDRAVEISGDIFEWMSLCAIEMSIELARERGYYPNYGMSEWAKGKLPQDLYEEHYMYRFGESPKYKSRYKDNWEKVRKDLKVYGIRNGNLLANAPTATISYIVGVSQSILPDYTLLYAYETLSGTFSMINSVFVKEMKKRKMWNDSLIEALKKSDGDIKCIEGIPEDLKKVFCTAFDQDMFKLIDCAAERNIWIDQGQSFDIYYEGKSLKRVDEIISYGHDKLIKTFYYMRSRSASKIEKSSTRVVSVPTTTPLPEISSCSIEAMKRGEICESCQ